MEQEKLLFHAHNDKSLKKSRTYYKQVIQLCGIHLPGIPNSMFNEDLQECGKFIFLGACNNKCARRLAHVKPSVQRKADHKKFNKDCHRRHKEEKGNSAEDFQ